MPTKLNFPVLKKIEFFDLTKNGTLVRTYSGDELEGVKWRQMQNKIGDELGPGLYNFNFKHVNKPDLHKGTIRAVPTITKPIDSNDGEVSKLKNQLDVLNKRLVDLGRDSGGGVGVDVLLQVTRDSFTTQIDFYKAEILRKELLISKYEAEIETLNKENDDLTNQLNQNQSPSIIDKTLEAVAMLTKMRNTNVSPAISLKDSDTSDIPKEILDVLGLVDYTRVTQEQIDKIVSYMKMFVNNFPLKGQ